MNIHEFLDELKIDFPNDGIHFERSVDKLQELLIRKALHIAGGNKAQAGRLLGIKKTTMDYRTKRLGIIPESYESVEMVIKPSFGDEFDHVYYGYLDGFDL